MELEAGHVAIVTGGAGDVGRGVCRALTKAGAAVVVLDIDIAGAEGADRAIRCDVTDPSACAAAVDAVRHEFGGVNTSSTWLRTSCWGRRSSTSPKRTWSGRSSPDRPLTLRMMQLCHPPLKARGGGAIVNFASGAGPMAFRPRAHAAAKRPSGGLTEGGGAEWGRDNIRVNALCPRPAAPSASRRTAVDIIPLGRIGDSEEDIGSVVVFLAGPGRYITGRTLQVDGGAGAWR